MLQASYLWLLIISSVRSNQIVSIDKSVAPTKYCRDQERLITSEENDEYLLISAEVDTIVVMECRFCNDKEERQSKIWYYQDRYRENPEEVVELGMDNNASYNRIYTTPDMSLVIKELEVTDAGIYLCHGEEGQEVENKFNYRIEPIFKEFGAVHTEQGNITEWDKYREMYLASITTRFAVSQMSELAEIREVGIILHVTSEWGPWGPCEHCIGHRGYRSSLGMCRLKRSMNTTIQGKSDSSVYRFFQKSPSLPCKSILLEQEFPGVGTAVHYLPEFILKEPCKKCAHAKKKKGRKFRYAKRYVLAEGAYLTVICPESSLGAQVSWKKDSITLEKGVRRSFRKLDEAARVIVDVFGTLYLIGIYFGQPNHTFHFTISHVPLCKRASDVSIDEQGNYTCYIDNASMMQLKVIVIPKTRLLTQEFLRHLGYLGFIFLLCSLCYCTGLIYTYRRRHKFDVIGPGGVSTKRKEEGDMGEDEIALLD